MSVLIENKHPKVIIIDYYDDLISRVDIYAEDFLKKISLNEPLIELKEYVPSRDEDDEDMFYYQPISNQFEDTYSDKYKYCDDPGPPQQVHLLKDFIHSKRMKAIEAIRLLQIKNLEELKASGGAPKLTRDELFEKTFGFLLKIDENNKKVKMKFRLLTIIVDFYLDKDSLDFVENLVNRKNSSSKIQECLDEKCAQVHLLAKYIQGKVELSKERSDCVVRVDKAQLYAVEKIDLYLPKLNKFKLDGSFDLSCVKSLKLNPLNLYDIRGKQIELNLSGLTHLQFIELVRVEIDSEQSNPFVNLPNLRRLKLYRCKIKNLNAQLFSTQSTNLEILELFKSELLPLNYLANFNSLKFLTLNHRLIDNVNFLENLTNLIVLKLDSTKITHFEDETFKSLKSLNVLHIRAENFLFGKGKWLEYLTNLRELNLSDVKLDRADLIGIGQHLTKLEKFQFEKFFLGHIKLNNLSREVLSGLKALKFLHFQGIFIENIESNAFECLNGLTELILTDVHIPLELNSSFGRLKLLRRLNFTDNSLKMIKDEFFFQNFPNLRHLNLRHSYDLTLTPLVFQKLTNLVSLNLSQINNVLEQLAENVFVNLNRLIQLSLRRCELTSLVEGWFNGLGELRELDLGENRFGKFNFQILRQMPKLKRISLCLFESDETSNAREFLNLGIELVDFDLFIAGN